MSRRERARRRFLRRWAPVVGRREAVAAWNGDRVGQSRIYGSLIDTPESRALLGGTLYSTSQGYADPLNRGTLQVDVGDGNGWQDISGAVRDLQFPERPHPHTIEEHAARDTGRRGDGNGLRAMLRSLTGRN